MNASSPEPGTALVLQLEPTDQLPPEALFQLTDAIDRSRDVPVVILCDQGRPTAGRPSAASASRLHLAWPSWFVVLWQAWAWWDGGCLTIPAIVTRLAG